MDGESVEPCAGNTPTCVGKTEGTGRIDAGREKHPHVRGEDLHIAGHVHADWETPPRAWGRQFPLHDNERPERNTPTCVGKTFGNMYTWNPIKKHPHVRGEDPCTARVFNAGLETPPRAWGRPCRFIDDTRCKERCLDSSFYIENISAKVLTFSKICGVVFPRCS